MKILVTGATGNVGKYVVKELLKKGEEVVAGGTNRSKIKKLFGDEVQYVEFDFEKPQTFVQALNQVEQVFFMRPPHMGDATQFLPFIEYLQAIEVKMITFLSLMGIEKNPFPPHYKIEKYIEKSGIPFVHIRPGFFMQNISGIHSKDIRDEQKILVPAGKSRTSFIDAEDIGFAIAQVMSEPEKHKNSSYTLTGNEALNYYEIASILSNTTKKNITYTDPSFYAYRNYYINNRGFDKKYVNITIALYFMTRLGTAKKVTNDFMKLTGRQPRSFYEFAEKNKSLFM